MFKSKIKKLYWPIWLIIDTNSGYMTKGEDIRVRLKL